MGRVGGSANRGRDDVTVLIDKLDHVALAYVVLEEAQQVARVLYLEGGDDGFVLDEGRLQEVQRFFQLLIPLLDLEGETVHFPS